METLKEGLIDKGKISPPKPREEMTNGRPAAPKKESIKTGHGTFKTR